MHDLYRHPQSPTLAVSSVQASVSMQADGALKLVYALSGDLSRLHVPLPCPPERRDGLWKRTCFEVFVAQPGHAPYREFNFSPAGHWQAFTFSSYRQGSLLETAVAPHIDSQQEATRLTLSATLPAHN